MTTSHKTTQTIVTNAKSTSKSVLMATITAVSALTMVGCMQAGAIEQARNTNVAANTSTMTSNPKLAQAREGQGRGDGQGARGSRADGHDERRHERGDARRGEHGHRHDEKDMFAGLNLTAAQQAQIDAIKARQQSNRPTPEARHAQREAEHARMQALIQSPTLSEATLNQMADAKAAEAKQRFIEQVRTRHAMYQVLTPAQREAWQNRQAQQQLQRQAPRQ